MLTVKHIARDGTETIMEAERVELVRTEDRYGNGIFLDREERELNSSARTFKHVVRFPDNQDCSSDDIPAMVYVMNRWGTTVATYKLDDLAKRAGVLSGLAGVAAPVGGNVAAPARRNIVNDGMGTRIA